MQHDLDPWDRGRGEPPSRSPGLHRISPQEDLPLTTSATRTSSESRTRPASSTAATSPALISPDPDCPRCRGVGHLVADVRYGHPQFGQLIRCGCLEATLVTARQTAAAARAAQLTRQLAAELGRLASCTLDQIDRRRPCVDLIWEGQVYSQAEQRRLLNRACGIARHYAPSESLYLYGPPGSAKSHIAASLLNAQAQAAVAARYGSMPALLRLLRGGFRDGTADERLEALMAADLLVIDDLGVEQGGDWAYAQFFDLLSIRINRALPTIITSNLPPAAHEPRIASRIAGEFALLPLILSDYRLIQAEQRAVRAMQA